MGVDAREQALVLMWCDICALQGYLGIQERFRNSSDFPEGRALPGPVSYDQIAALVDRGDKRIEAFFDGLDPGLVSAELQVGEGVADKRARDALGTPEACKRDDECPLGERCGDQDTCRRVEHWEITGEPEWIASGFVVGLKHLPVAYKIARS